MGFVSLCIHIILFLISWLGGLIAGHFLNFFDPKRSKISS